MKIINQFEETRTKKKNSILWHYVIIIENESTDEIAKNSIKSLDSTKLDFIMYEDIKNQIKHNTILSWKNNRRTLSNKLNEIKISIVRWHRNIITSIQIFKKIQPEPHWSQLTCPWFAYEKWWAPICLSCGIYLSIKTF